MIKQAIKYYTLSLFLLNTVFSQNAINYYESTIDELNRKTNNSSTSIQSLLNYNNEINKYGTEKSVFESINNREEKSRIEIEFFKPAPVNIADANKPVKQEFNIVSSFRENIRFGGFWENYAIINFNPSVNLKPVDFISIYANQNLSCFIPISGIKENIKTLLIHGTAVLAVDNAVKLVFLQNEWVPQAIGFAAKNIIISLLKGAFNTKTENKIYNHDSYYFAVSVRF